MNRCASNRCGGGGDPDLDRWLTTLLGERPAAIGVARAERGSASAGKGYFDAHPGADTESLSCGPLSGPSCGEKVREAAEFAACCTVCAAGALGRPGRARNRT